MKIKVQKTFEITRKEFEVLKVLSANYGTSDARSYLADFMYLGFECECRGCGRTDVSLSGANLIDGEIFCGACVCSECGYQKVEDEGYALVASIVESCV